MRLTGLRLEDPEPIGGVAENVIVSAPDVLEYADNGKTVEK